jgi:two-component system OmpR family response regulator
MNKNETRVLIMEDDEMLREIYTVKLEMEGFLVESAANGAEGLERASKQEPDLILLDMIMPRMTGLEFLEAYDLAGKHPTVKTVVLSNKSSIQDINAAKSLGALDYLVKAQHTPDQIVERLRTYLDSKA